MFLREKNYSIFRSKALRQTLYLYISHLFVLGTGFLINILNTRYLGPVSYGLYALAFAVADFTTLFVDFGFYSSGARVIATTESKQTQREIVGALLLITLGLAFISSLIVLTLSYYAKVVLRADAGHFLRLFFVLFGLLGLESFIEAVCRGQNKIETLSLFQIVSKILIVLAIFGAILIHSYNLETAIFLSLCGTIISAFIIVCIWRPHFADLTKSFSIIVKDLRSYGYKAYFSNLASTASYRTDSLLISYFVSSTAVGYYRLSSLLTYPIVSFSRSLSTTFFRKFASANHISSRVLILNTSWLLLCVLGLVCLGEYLIMMFFGQKYQSVTPLIYPMTAAALFSGLSQPYNMFIGAKGKGSYLRNIAFIVTGFNIGFNFLLIPKYLTIGACYASAISMLANLVLHIFYYTKTKLTEVE